MWFEHKFERGIRHVATISWYLTRFRMSLLGASLAMYNLSYNRISLLSIYMQNVRSNETTFDSGSRISLMFFSDENLWHN